MLCSISLSSCSCLSSIMRLLMRLKLLVSSTSHYFHRTDYRFFSALIGHSLLFQVTAHLTRIHFANGQTRSVIILIGH